MAEQRQLAERVASVKSVAGLSSDEHVALCFCKGGPCGAEAAGGARDAGQIQASGTASLRFCEWAVDLQMRRQRRAWRSSSGWLNTRRSHTSGR